MEHMGARVDGATLRVQNKRERPVSKRLVSQAGGQVPQPPGVRGAQPLDPARPPRAGRGPARHASRYGSTHTVPDKDALLPTRSTRGQEEDQPGVERHAHVATGHGAARARRADVKTHERPNDPSRTGMGAFAMDVNQRNEVYDKPCRTVYR